MDDVSRERSHGFSISCCQPGFCSQLWWLVVKGKETYAGSVFFPQFTCSACWFSRYQIAPKHQYGIPGGNNQRCASQSLVVQPCATCLPCPVYISRTSISPEEIHAQTCNMSQKFQSIWHSFESSNHLALSEPFWRSCVASWDMKRPAAAETAGCRPKKQKVLPPGPELLPQTGAELVKFGRSPGDAGRCDSKFETLQKALLDLLKRRGATKSFGPIQLKSIETTTDLEVMRAKPC